MTPFKTMLFVCLVVNFYSCKDQANHPTSSKSELSHEFWVDETSTYLPITKEWTNRVEVADINGDGMLDLIFANGGNYSEPGEPESSRIFINKGPNTKFQEVTDEVFKNEKYISRVIKVRDINNDGIPDIIVGTTYQTQSQLYIGLGMGKFKNVTLEQFPNIKASIGDLELGDVDDDGDLDIVLADWGPGSNMNNNGGRTMLWLNDGNGYFKDVTETQMPDLLIQFSWDLEFFDFDNDFDLDMAISCKRCATSRIFVNDGRGFFEDKRLLPAYTNNYELEPMDINGDGFLDLITVNDGEIVNGESFSRREHIFLNQEGKRFIDATDSLWSDSENIGEDDNNIVFLDYDSDNDPDFLISSLTGEDRLLENDSSGKFKLIQPVLKGAPTPLTLSMVLGDINNDKKLDIIMGQGEGEEGIEERIFIGKDISPDTASPKITHYLVTNNETDGTTSIKARIHDNKSPNMPQDWSSVEVLSSDGSNTTKMTWYGENLWIATVPLVLYNQGIEICAIDYAGNKACLKLK
ncbi:FG-GAP repeat domain-containing protein [Geojedonia litorea]|uniref:FG-GAP repeat domain-containing protein n=1 Tax=Geojedonia litorea TaxID=1268269 RepID=A0ABV9N3E4_9FLAO